MRNSAEAVAAILMGLLLTYPAIYCTYAIEDHDDDWDYFHTVAATVCGLYNQLGDRAYYSTHHIASWYPYCSDRSYSFIGFNWYGVEMYSDGGGWSWWPGQPIPPERVTKTYHFSGNPYWWPTYAHSIVTGYPNPIGKGASAWAYIGPPGVA